MDHQPRGRRARGLADVLVGTAAGQDGGGEVGGRKATLEMKKLTVGSLFAGIGGFDLGLEWTGGFDILWQVEIEDYATKVLEKHWPNVRRWRDVRTFPPEPASDWEVDLICGGFPCQDISDAGKKAGIDGERSRLWREFARCIRILRPRYVVVENTAALLHRGMGKVLGDLAQCGYAAEWDCLPAAAFGARHFRNRLFIVATPDDLEHLDFQSSRGVLGPKREETGRWCQAAGNGLERDWAFWPAEPSVARTLHGVPHRVDRHRVLGNAVVPQVARWIGQRVLEATQRLADERRRWQGE